MGDFAQVIYFCEIEVFGFSDSQYLFSLEVIEELAFLVEEFECVPLLGIVASSEDNSTRCLEACNCEFGSRCGGKSDIDDIVAHTYECAANELVHHFAR